MSMVLATFQIGASYDPWGGEDSWYSCTADGEKWNWIVEIACQTLVFETAVSAVIEEGLENITWALSIKQTPY